MDHSTECSPQLVAALIAIEQRGEPCWRVNKYLGSMLTFDFGAHDTLRTRSSVVVPIGSSTLGVRRIWWGVDGAGLEPFSSDDLDEQPERWRQLDQALRGTTLIGCGRHEGDTIFGFANGVRLSLDGGNVYQAEPDEAVMSLRLSGGAYFEMLPDGRILLDLEESVRERAAA